MKAKTRVVNNKVVGYYCEYDSEILIPLKSYFLAKEKLMKIIDFLSDQRNNGGINKEHYHLYDKRENLKRYIQRVECTYFLFPL